MSKHTLEPWVYVPGPGGGSIEDANGAQIAVISGQAPLHGDQTIPLDEVQRANGRLIAAAPRLLRSLQWIRDRIETNAVDLRTIRREVWVATHDAIRQTEDEP